MKKLSAVEIILFSMFLAFLSIPKASQSCANLRVAFPVPEGLLNTEPLIMLENFNESYLNTTNPYSNITSPMSVFDEISEIEAHHPVYVLVAGDEEERQIIRTFGRVHDWKSWATLQIERGDESLVANFGIDIRILGFVEWNSDNSKSTMKDLWYDLKSKTGHYLHTVYSGEWWNYVDAIIGITGQPTNDGVPGVAEFGGNYILIKWQVYWMDDNIVQHEVSHLFFADDHWDTCCVMAGHPHFHTWIYEDGLWTVFWDIPCCSTAYSWHNECFTVINQHKSRFQPDLPILLYVYDPYQNRPMTIYYWYDETNNLTWREIKSFASAAVTR